MTPTEILEAAAAFHGMSVSAALSNLELGLWTVALVGVTLAVVFGLLALRREP
jgi:hypothetical protein